MRARPRGVRVVPGLATAFAVAAHQRTDAATIVELASGRVTHVTLGVTPHEVAVSPDARLAVLTSPSGWFRRNRTLIVLDLATARIARRIHLGDHEAPHGVAFVSDSVVLVSALRGTGGGIAILDLQAGRIARLPATQPRRITVTADGRRVVVSDRDQVRVVDTAQRGLDGLAYVRR